MGLQTFTHEADVLIVGGGAAGCYAAIKAKEHGADKVIQIDKGHVGKSGFATFGAGVLTTFCPEEDDYDWVFKTLIEEACYIADQQRLKQHLELIWSVVNEMQGFGVEFEKAPDGKLQRFPGRGIIPNIMFHGPQMMEAMGRQAQRCGVEQIHKTMMTDLLTCRGCAAGAVAFDIVTGDWHVLRAKATVLACGSTFYKGRPPGGRSNTCDGQAAFYRAGGEIVNMDFTRHNSNAADYDLGSGMHMIVGTGGIFRNSRGERFMPKYDPKYGDKTELYNLTTAMAMEAKRGNAPIYLDMTHFTSEQVQRLKRVIPLPMSTHERAGTLAGDRFVKTIGWVANYPGPSQGGPLVDKHFETHLPGLFAVGDVAPWSGFGGGASALVGAFTSGAVAGRFAAELSKTAGVPEINNTSLAELKWQTFQPLNRRDGVEPDNVLIATQEAIAPYNVFIIREESRLVQTLQRIEDIRDNLVPYLHAYDPHYLRMALEARNLVTIAEMSLRSALFRKESRVGRIREDYPYMDNVKWAKWVCAKQDSGKMEIYARDLPFDSYPLKPPVEKALDARWKQAKELGIVDIREERIAWV